MRRGDRWLLGVVGVTAAGVLLAAWFYVAWQDFKRYHSFAEYRRTLGEAIMTPAPLFRR